KLASAATFRRSGAAFDRSGQSKGWDEHCMRVIPPQDPVLAPLTVGEPFALDDVADDARLPSGLKRPILAVPPPTRARCFAIAFSGPHASGAELDSNEREMLARLGRRAADGYAELEAAALRSRIAALEQQLSAQGLRPQPDAA